MRPGWVLYSEAVELLANERIEDVLDVRVLADTWPGSRREKARWIWLTWWGCPLRLILEAFGAQSPFSILVALVVFDTVSQEGSNDADGDSEDLSDGGDNVEQGGVG